MAHRCDGTRPSSALRINRRALSCPVPSGLSSGCLTDISDLIGSDARELTGDARATGEKTFGRQDEVHALARLLANKKSVVLVGPHGVGKTAVIQKLLSYLAEGRLPELAGARVYEVSTMLLCSDTRYTGMQESRIRSLLAFATPLRIHYVTDVWN